MTDASRYRADIDLRNVNDSHTLAIAGVPARSAVLDIGLADGSVESVLRRLGCRIWAIEIDPIAAKAAEPYCEEVVVGDIEALDLEACFTQRFDVVLLLDVLEHLKDPVGALKKVAGVLAPGGWVVISCPNVTHGAVRLQLLHGHWSYTALGLLDETHLRFFDRAGFEALLADAGFSVFDRSRVIRRLDATEIPVDIDREDPTVLAELADDPDADTYQFVFYAAPENGQAAKDPPLLPSRILQERTRQLERIEQSASQHIGMLEAKVTWLEAEVQRLGPIQAAGQAWMLDELSDLLAQCRQRRRILAEMLTELQESSDRLASEILR